MSGGVDTKYDTDSGSFKFSLSITNGNLCYFVQSIFFFISAIGMYMIYCEANVLDTLKSTYPTVTLDEFNLLFCTVALLLLNETFFIPDRWRLLCKIISCYLVWNNFEAAGCSAKSMFHDVDASSVTGATGDQVRIARAGMLFVLMAVVGSFLASYLVPNGRQKTAFSSYKFVKSSTLQSVLYIIAVVFLLVATFVQWSRDDTCGKGGATTAGAVTPKNYNATLLFLAFWFIFGLCTNDANTLDIAFSILAAEIVTGRPTPFTEAKILAVYSLVFCAAIFVCVGAMLHSGIYLNKFTTEGMMDRVKSWGFLIHIVSLILGIAGSACIFSRSSDDKDKLWMAFFTGWAPPVLGILGHLFDAEAALVPMFFFVPQAFTYYGQGFASSSTSSDYPKGYTRAGSLLLLIVPIISSFAFYCRNIKVESLDSYLKADGAATMRSAGLLFLGSALYWKASQADFWAIAFIAALIFISSYNQRSALPKAALLLCIERVTVKSLWLISNDPGLTMLQNVILVIGYWLFIGTFSTASPDMSTGLECIHEINNARSASGEDGEYSEIENDTAAPLITNRDDGGAAKGYTAVGDENDNNDDNTNNNAEEETKNGESDNNNKKNKKNNKNNKRPTPPPREGESEVLAAPES